MTTVEPIGKPRIPPATELGTVRLTVSDLSRSRAFYEQTLGLPAWELEEGTLAFGGERPLIELRGDTTAPRLDRSATGLYHLAILVPSRRELALALARMVTARRPLDGASDHLVSEALYLSDPDGNGIEIYRDRPREEWPRTGDRLEMATLPLDLDHLLGELAHGGGMQRIAPPSTRIGHIHLQVSDLREAESFYSGVLGFEVTVRGYPSALFVSAGGYHHHIGLNTWHSAGGSPPPPGAIGLRNFEVTLPSDEAVGEVLGRVSGAGIQSEQSEIGVIVRDPAGNALVLRSA